MNSLSIGKCEWRGQAYCLECTDAANGDAFCSMDCEDDFQEDKAKIAEENEC